MSEIEQLKERIKELEHQLAESRICEICKDKAVLAADKYREQNAKLVDALGKIASCLPWHDEENAKVCVEIAREVLKEVGNE